MVKLTLLSILVSAVTWTYGQGETMEVRVVKYHSIDITPDTPYLISAHKYQFAITGTRGEDEIIIGIDKGKAILKDTLLYITPRYTKGDRHTESDTMTVTIRVRDTHQAEKSSFKKQYIVYSPLNKPSMAPLQRNMGRIGPYSAAYWGDWMMGTYDADDNPPRNTDIAKHIFANLNNEFTYIKNRPADTVRLKYSTILMIRYNPYQRFYAEGSKLTPEMINAVVSGGEGCAFRLELDDQKRRGGYQRIFYFDTRVK